MSVRRLLFALPFTVAVSVAHSATRAIQFAALGGGDEAPHLYDAHGSAVSVAYGDRFTVGVRLNPDVLAKSRRVMGRIVDDKGNTSQPQTMNATAEGERRFDGTALEPGRHFVRAAAVTAGGLPLAESREPFTVFPAAEHEVVIDHRNVIHVNGQPILPLGMFCVSFKDHENEAESCAGHGLDLVHLSGRFPGEKQEVWLKRHGLRVAPELWEEVGKINRELSEMSGHLLFGEDLTPELDHPEDIHVLAMKHGDSTRLIAVNSTKQKIETTFTRAKGLTQVTAPCEGRQLQVEANAFRDSFAKWGVHIYEVKGPGLE